MISRRSLLGWLALFVFATLPGLARADDPAKDIPAKLREAEKKIDELNRLILEQRALIAALGDLQDLKRRVLALEQKVEALPKTQTLPALFQQTGTIRLENRLGVPATFIVNDVPYRLLPLQTRNLTGFQAGAFTYEVLVDGAGSLQPRVVRTLAANATYTLFTY